MPFNFNPRIFSLLVCSQVERDDVTGGWRIQPFSHLAVHGLPVPIHMVLFANIMAPPGDYQLTFRIFHQQENDGAILANPVTIRTQPGKNIEFMAKVTVTLHNTGLYLVEAQLADFDTAYTPIRISNIGDLMIGGQA